MVGCLLMVAVHKGHEEVGLNNKYAQSYMDANPQCFFLKFQLNALGSNNPNSFCKAKFTADTSNSWFSPVLPFTPLCSFPTHSHPLFYSVS